MKTKMLSTILALIVLSFASFANANKFKCVGEAEYGAVIIERVVVSKVSIDITYTVKGDTFLRKYITTEWMEKNGHTDAQNPAYFIGATISGQKNDYDDLALPHFGRYKDGVGSEIAFNHEGKRLFGTVTCN